jgi:hypothetical protein
MGMNRPMKIKFAQEINDEKEAILRLANLHASANSTQKHPAVAQKCNITPVIYSNISFQKLLYMLTALLQNK